MIMRCGFSTWFVSFCLAALLLSGCAAAPQKPIFQPLTLDLSGDLAPRDPALPPGSDVYCVVAQGTALIDRQWRAYAQTGFILPGNGMMSSVRLQSTRGGGSAAMRAYYDEPGQKMIFCPVLSAAPGGVIDCASLYAMNQDIADGIKRTFDVPDAIQNAHISCAFDQTRLLPL